MNRSVDPSDVGQASADTKPNTETGIHLHAASGTVSVQAQSGKLTAAADRKVTIASTNGSLNASAKTHFLATAQGAYLRLDGGNIELHAPGRVEFRASQKNLTGPQSSSSSYSFPAVSAFPDSVCIPCMLKAAQSGSAFASKG